MLSANCQSSIIAKVLFGVQYASGTVLCIRYCWKLIMKFEIIAWSFSYLEFSYATFLQVEFYYKYFSCLLQSLLKLLRYQQAYVIYDKMEKKFKWLVYQYVWPSLQCLLVGDRLNGLLGLEHFWWKCFILMCLTRCLVYRTAMLYLGLMDWPQLKEMRFKKQTNFLRRFYR